MAAARLCGNPTWSWEFSGLQWQINVCSSITLSTVFAFRSLSRLRQSRSSMGVKIMCLKSSGSVSFIVPVGKHNFRELNHCFLSTGPFRKSECLMSSLYLASQKWSILLPSLGYIMWLGLALGYVMWLHLACFPPDAWHYSIELIDFTPHFIQCL